MKAIARFLMRQSEWLFSGPLALFYWIALGVIGAATVWFGSLGWLAYDLNPDGDWVKRTSEQPEWMLYVDAVHRGFKALFSSDLFMEGDIAETPKNILAARYLGSLFFILLAGRIFFFAVGGRLAKLFARARVGHDIVIGDSPTAYRYMKAVNRRVNHLHFGPALTSGAGHERVVNLQRSNNFGRDLKKAGLKRARRVVVAEEGDEKVWATARAAAAAPGAGHKEIIANIEDPWLLERISRADPDARIRPFSYASGAARQIMLAHPPFLLARAYNAPAQHIVIIGFGAMGQALLREFLITSISYSPSQMMATIIDPEAERLSAQFQARHPGIAPYVDVAFLKGDPTMEDETLESRFAERRRRSAPCAVYVAISEAQNPLRFAVGIKDRAERLGWFKAPIFVRAPDGAGLTVMRQGCGVVGRPVSPQEVGLNILKDLSLAPSGGWMEALDGAGLLSREFDDQARVFHNAYRKLVGADAKPAAQCAPGQKPWELLSEEFRVSNRRVAAHIRVKLDAAGFDLASWLEAGAKGRPHFSHETPDAAHELDLDDMAELDRLAALEHHRWCVDRALNGWRYGAERDDERRVHPLLVKERHLSESEREKDRGNIRETALLIRDIANGDYKKSK